MSSMLDYHTPHLTLPPLTCTLYLCLGLAAECLCTQTENSCGCLHAFFMNSCHM
jgi:hypothetical protein